MVLANLQASPLGTDSDSDGRDGRDATHGTHATRAQMDTPPVPRPYMKKRARVGFATGGCRLDPRALVEIETKRAAAEAAAVAAAAAEVAAAAAAAAREEERERLRSGGGGEEPESPRAAKSKSHPSKKVKMVKRSKYVDMACYTRCELLS